MGFRTPGIKGISPDLTCCPPGKDINVTRDQYYYVFLVRHYSQCINLPGRLTCARLVSFIYIPAMLDVLIFK